MYADVRLYVIKSIPQEEMWREKARRTSADRALFADDENAGNEVEETSKRARTARAKKKGRAV